MTTATASEILSLLMKHSDKLKKTQAEPAIGLGIKICKEAGINAEGKLVKHAVISIRND